MIINHIWSILCKESVINKDNNNISIHESLEKLSISLSKTETAQKLPKKIIVPITYELVSFWTKENKKKFSGIIEYSLISPEEDILFTRTQDLDIPTKVKRHRTRMKIQGVPFTNAGVYMYKIKVKEKSEKSYKTVSKIPLEVAMSLETNKKAD